MAYARHVDISRWKPCFRVGVCNLNKECLALFRCLKVLSCVAYQRYAQHVKYCQGKCVLLPLVAPVASIPGAGLRTESQSTLLNKHVERSFFGGFKGRFVRCVFSRVLGSLMIALRRVATWNSS